jgi:undecaprenyl-diphosphatase
VSTDLFRALVLGIVQGLTEFLPVSSSAHLTLTPWLLGWQAFDREYGLTFDVALHIGTLVAMLWYFRDMWIRLFQAVLARVPELAPERRLARDIAIACVPAVIAGVLLQKKAETTFRDPLQIACLLIGMGIVMGIVDRLPSRHRRLKSMGWRDALFIGLAQSAALLPGVSRSGSTITAGLVEGFEREDAARFSFLLSVPITGGAILFELRHVLAHGMPAHEIGVFAVGILSSLIVGYFAVAGLLAFLRRYSLTVFVVYRILFGLFVIAVLASRGALGAH